MNISGVNKPQNIAIQIDAFGSRITGLKIESVSSAGILFGAPWCS